MRVLSWCKIEADALPIIIMIKNTNKMIVVDFLAIHANQKMESPFQRYGRQLYDFNLSSCNYIALFLNQHAWPTTRFQVWHKRIYASINYPFVIGEDS